MTLSLVDFGIGFREIAVILVPGPSDEAIAEFSKFRDFFTNSSGKNFSLEIELFLDFTLMNGEYKGFLKSWEKALTF